MFISIIWLPAALFAGLFQAWRTAVQQRLRSQLTVSGAGLVRYLYGAPIALLILTLYATAHHHSLPSLSLPFLANALIGGVAQIIATNLLIAAFGYGNFVVGTAFSKTETVQVAVFAWLVLHEALTLYVIIGIVLGVVGVLILSLGGKKITLQQLGAALKQRVAIFGLSAGAMFALTAVFVKRATFDLQQPDLILAALITLTVVMLSQTVIHGMWIAWREPTTLRQVFVTWPISSQVGILAALGSACWFIGFATASVALVRIVGQVEVIFTLLFAQFYLGEKIKSHEASGLLLVATGVTFALVSSLLQ